MDENPYRSPECEPSSSSSTYPERTNAVRDAIGALVAFAMGVPVGWYALVHGAHGGSPISTIVMSAPVALAAHFVFGDKLAYAYAMIGGTGALYAGYAILLSRRRWRTVLGVHSVGVLALLALWAMA